jgi:hypothetical protein
MAVIAGKYRLSARDKLTNGENRYRISLLSQ